MRLYDVSGKLTFKNVKAYKIEWDAKSRSIIQFKVKQYLKHYWQSHVVYEEFPVYGTRLKCDIINMTLKICVEVDGAQHESFNKFFHNNSRAAYLGSIKRDIAKEKWLDLNSFKLIRIYQNEVDHLSNEFFKSKFDLVL